MSKNHKWRVVAASVTGTSHQKRGQPCQDAHYWQILPGDVLVAAIADGAGSAAFSDVGAQIATRVSAEAIAQRITTPLDDYEWKFLLKDALNTARQSLEAEAAVRNIPLRDLASTLIIVIATPVLIAAAQVGDGASVVSNGSKNEESNAPQTVLTLTTPQRGEYANQTTFLISENAIETAQITLWHGTPTQLAILSDGLQMLALKMPDCTPHLPFFSPLFRFIVEETDGTKAQEQLSAFLRSPRVTERTDDDLTLLLATLN